MASEKLNKYDKRRSKSNEWMGKNSNFGSSNSSTSYVCTSTQGRGTRQHKFLLNYKHFICSLSLFVDAPFTKERLSVRLHVSNSNNTSEFRYLDLYFVMKSILRMLSWWMLCMRWIRRNENARFQSTLKLRFVFESYTKQRKKNHDRENNTRFETRI